MNSAIYRDNEVVAASRRDQALARWREELAALSEDVKRIYARRVARSLAGVAAIGAAGAMVVATLVGGRGATRFLLLAGPVAVLAYLVGAILAPRRLAARLRRASEPGPDVWADLARFEDGGPGAIVQAAADRLERVSVALPMIGAAFCLPLTIHYGYFLWQSHGLEGPDPFDEWIRLSTVLVGHCHVILAVLCWRYAVRLRRRPTAELAWAPARDGWSAWGITTAASIFPGVALLFIPLVLVAVTGVLFIPAMFRFMSVQVARERVTLADWSMLPAS
jgi:hypothetical protein